MKALLQSIFGSWSGHCRTWFRPGELVDESPIEGTFELLHSEVVVRHAYKSTINDEVRRGEERIAFNVSPTGEEAWASLHERASC